MSMYELHKLYTSDSLISMVTLVFVVFQQYLYGTQARHLSYNDFINKELILFSNSDNERSIPSLVDGTYAHYFWTVYFFLSFFDESFS